MLTQDYSGVQIAAVSTPYREQVLRAIPIHLQELIRRECGDRQIKNTFFIELPARCSLRVAQHEAKSTAAALRANVELPRELNWHLAAVAQSLENAAVLEQPIRALHRDLSRL